MANATRIGIVQHSGVAEDNVHADNVHAELASRYPSDLVPASWLQAVHSCFQDREANCMQKVTELCELRGLLESAQRREGAALTMLSKPHPPRKKQDDAARLIQHQFHRSQSLKRRDAVAMHKATRDSDSQQFASKLAAVRSEAEALASVAEQERHNAKHFYEVARGSDAKTMAENVRKVHAQADSLAALAGNEIDHLQQQLGDADREHDEVQVEVRCNGAVANASAMNAPLFSECGCIFQVDRLRGEVAILRRSSAANELQHLLAAVDAEYQNQRSLSRVVFENESQAFQLANHKAQVAQHKQASVFRASRDQKHKAATSIQTQYLRHRQRSSESQTSMAVTHWAGKISLTWGKQAHLKASSSFLDSFDLLA